ncbi:MAG: hypothetical protein Q4G25_10580 [Paracoccus sp. (in: a-proteobacteria)]|nr:hypothetical protein [Paracoccus sp. (in: a-proteobacteria)]
MTQAEKARQLKALHIKARPVTLCNIRDAGGARIGFGPAPCLEAMRAFGASARV